MKHLFQFSIFWAKKIEILKTLTCRCTLNKFIMSGVEETKTMRAQLRKLLEDMQKVTDEVRKLKKSHAAQDLEIERLKRRMQMTKREVTTLQSSTETSCQGCLTNQPNQLAHMEEGGCLA